MSTTCECKRCEGTGYTTENGFSIVCSQLGCHNGIFDRDEYYKSWEFGKPETCIRCDGVGATTEDTHLKQSCELCFGFGKMMKE